MERSSVAVDPTRTFKPIRIAVLTISDSRDMASDSSGALLEQRIKAAGHSLAARAVVKDEVPIITGKLNSWIDDGIADAIITTGGTGLTGRDVTPEALDRIKDKDISALASCSAGSVIKTSAPAPSKAAPAPCWRAGSMSLPCPDRTVQ